MEKVKDLIEKGVIVQGVLVIMIAGTYCFMVATGRPAPEALERLLWAMVGFYFGSQGSVVAMKKVEAYLQKLGLQRDEVS